TKVLSEGKDLSIQVGANDNQRIKINMLKVNTGELGIASFNVNGQGSVANEAATKDSLVLKGFELDAATSANSVQRYTKVTDNTAATGADVLGRVKEGDTATYTGTNTGFNKAASGSYTYGA